MNQRSNIKYLDIKLKNENVILRNFCTSDYTEEYISWLNDPEVVKYSNQRFKVHTQETCLNYFNSFENTENLYLAIEDAKSRKVQGSMTAFQDRNHSTADIGILVGNRDAWFKGIGFNAWMLLMEFLFRTVKVRKVTAGTLKSNLAMVRLIEKLQMRQEATLSEHEVINGKTDDILLFCKFSNCS